MELLVEYCSVLQYFAYIILRSKEPALFFLAKLRSASVCQPAINSVISMQFGCLLAYVKKICEVPPRVALWVLRHLQVISGFVQPIVSCCLDAQFLYVSSAWQTGYLGSFKAAMSNPRAACGQFRFSL